MDEQNVESFNLYALVRNQVKLAPMGEVIGLDNAAVLSTLRLYVAEDEVKKAFELVLKCYQIEQELI